jgi:hypothetical protein
MQAIPERWEGERQLILINGRWLTKEDNVEKRPVCMVHQNFASGRGVRVGDVISLQLRDSRQLVDVTVMGGIEFSVDTEIGMFVKGGEGYRYPGRYDGYMHTVEFETAAIAPERLELEVVGIYGRRTGSAINETTASSNEIYIPEFCMPTEFGGETRANAIKFLYSFVLRSHRDKDAFIEETRDSLAGMGLSAAFLDNNAEAFWDVMDPLMESKLISLCV